MSTVMDLTAQSCLLPNFHSVKKQLQTNGWISWKKYISKNRKKVNYDVKCT